MARRLWTGCLDTFGGSWVCLFAWKFHHLFCACLVERRGRQCYERDYFCLFVGFVLVKQCQSSKIISIFLIATDRVVFPASFGFMVMISSKGSLYLFFQGYCAAILYFNLLVFLFCVCDVVEGYCSICLFSLFLYNIVLYVKRKHVHLCKFHSSIFEEWLLTCLAVRRGKNKKLKIEGISFWFSIHEKFGVFDLLGEVRCITHIPTSRLFVSYEWLEMLEGWRLPFLWLICQYTTFNFMISI